MKKYYILIYCLLFGFITTQAQTITLDIGSVQGMPGDTVFVPVTASSSPGSANLLTIQGTIKFSNTTGLSFESLTSSTISMNSGFYAELSNDVITFSISTGSPLLTITQGTPLFEIEVKILEEGCTEISIIDGPTLIQFGDTNFNELPVDSSDTGQVCTNCLPEDIELFANGNDITNSLTYTLPCYQNTVAVTTTHLINVSYLSPELGASNTGNYTLPSNNTLQTFTIEITGEDTCGEDYIETVTVHVESLKPAVIKANGDDITNSLTYSLACNEDTVDLSTTHLTNVSYFSPELGSSNTGDYTRPISLSEFVIYVYGTDTCGDPYEEKININTRDNTSFITNVELLSGGNYSNPTGNSPGNYGDYTDSCIPYYNSSSGLINVTTTEVDLYMSVYVDSNFYFNTLTNSGGTLINLAGLNIVGGEVIRIIVSENPITNSNDIPTCGEVEDYMLCFPPPECPLEALTSISSCSDNGTPLDPSDDFYNITLDVFNTQGQPWTLVNSFGSTIYFGNGDENNIDLGNYLVSNLSEGFQIRYDNLNCFLDFAVAAPTSCNFSCNISAVISTGDCNDNGTPNDSSDDYYFINLSVLGTNGVSWDLFGLHYYQTISYSGTGNTTNIQLGPISVNDAAWAMYITPTGLVDPGCRRYETTIFAPKCDGDNRPKGRNENKVSITPNPNRGKMDIEIDLDTDSVIELNIYRINGTLVKTIKKEKTNNKVLGFGLELGVPTGLYLFSFTTNKGIITKRVIIEHN